MNILMKMFPFIKFFILFYFILFMIFPLLFLHAGMYSFHQTVWWLLQNLYKSGSWKRSSLDRLDPIQKQQCCEQMKCIQIIFVSVQFFFHFKSCPVMHLISQSLFQRFVHQRTVGSGAARIFSKTLWGVNLFQSSLVTTP